MCVYSIHGQVSRYPWDELLPPINTRTTEQSSKPQQGQPLLNSVISAHPCPQAVVGYPHCATKYLPIRPLPPPWSSPRVPRPHPGFSFSRTSAAPSGALLPRITCRPRDCAEEAATVAKPVLGPRVHPSTLYLAYRGNGGGGGVRFLPFPHSSFFPPFFGTVEAESPCNVAAV